MRRDSASIPGGSANYVTKYEFDTKFREVNGHQNQFKSQLTEFHKRILKLPQYESDSKLNDVLKGLADVNGQVESLSHLRSEIAAIKSELSQTSKHAAVQQLYDDVARLKADISQAASQDSIRQLSEDMRQVKTSLGQSASQGNLQQLQADLAQFGQQIASMDQMRNELIRLGQMQQEVAKLGPMRNELTRLGQMQQEVAKIGQMQQEVAKIGQMQQEVAKIGQMQQEVAKIGQMQQEVAKIGQMQQGVAKIGQMQQEVARLGQMQQEVAKIGQVESELARLRADSAKINQIQNEVSKIGHMHNEVGKIGQIHSEVSKISQIQTEVVKIGQLQTEFRKLKEDSAMVTRLQNEVSKAKNDMTQGVEKISQISREMKGMKDDVSRVQKDMDQRARQMKQSLDQEMQKTGRELQGSSQKHDKHERELSQMKMLMNLPHELHVLKHTLNDLGVLKPPKVEKEEGEPPAVGTLELSEDCFTSRLLIRLSYSKAKAEKHRDAKELEETEADDSSVDGSIDSDYALQFLAACDNVYGIAPPELEEGDSGYVQVTTVFRNIALTTLFFQILIVAVLVYYGQTPTECYNHEPDLVKWTVLHGSKAAAILVAGALMGKDFMDIVNESMVAVLVEPRFDYETAVINGLRFILVILIGLANIFMFRGMVSPVSVWINMAALAFIGELGSAVNDQGRKGVFGHAIRGTLTSLNYELTFVSEYPWWIVYVQGGTMLFVAVFVSVSVCVVAIAADPMCHD